jgi:CDGSH-type Zn-finger protein
VTVTRNGPLLLRGDIRILDAEGNEVAVLEKAALCRCGGSSNKPFCDGTHRTNGFTG